MNRNWEEYFSKQLEGKNSLQYAIEHWVYHMPFVGKIQKHTSPPAKILDIGCGYGLTAICLQVQGYSVTGIDNEPSIVQHAGEMAKFFHSDVHFEVGSAFHLEKYYDNFDSVYSIGVLEHFDRGVTIELLREQAKCAPVVALNVPSKYTPEIIDERIYSITELKKIMQLAGLKVIDYFGYGLPPRLVWLRRILPYGMFRLLQNRYSQAMNLVVIGQRTNE